MGPTWKISTESALKQRIVSGATCLTKQWAEAAEGSEGMPSPEAIGEAYAKIYGKMKAAVLGE